MKTKIILICIVAFSFSFTLLNAQTIWRGPKMTFTKADNTDTSLANQDRITGNVSLTRGDGGGGLFNILRDLNAGITYLTGNLAPTDTEWAYGTIENYASLTYQNLPALINFENIVDGRNMVLHLITDDIYIDIKFLSWTAGGKDSNGGEGGFSYERSTPTTSISNPIVINEIFADPLNTSAGDANGDGTGSLLQDEFIELYNTAETAIDLTGWKLADADQDRHTFPQGTIIPAKGSLVVFGGGTLTSIPGVVQTATTGSLSLDDGGDTVTLKDAFGTVIKTVTYGAEAGDDQSIARNPDSTGDFVKHTTITTNAVRFSPGRDNTDGSVLAFIKNANHFVTTWNTETDDASSTSITLPVVAGVYDVDTNNDGTFDRLNLTGTQTLDLGSAGIHTIAVRPNSANTKNELQIQFANSNNPGKLTTIENWGTIVWTSMNEAFEGCINMNIALEAGVPDLSRVTDMTEMFKNLTGFTGNLSAWNVANVTNMNAMFEGAAVFNGDVSAWNVANVTNMNALFEGASVFNGDVSAWNVANVTDMSSMFQNAVVFNGDVSTWNVSKVTDMSTLFEDAAGFNGDVSTWNVASVTDMSSMFQNAVVFNGDVSTWNVASVTDMSSMFQNAVVFNGDVSTWNVASVTDMSHMFGGASVFNGNLSSWNVASVTDMTWMFGGASAFNGDLSSWNVADVTDMSLMFGGASVFNGDLSSWNVAGVTDMSHMFGGASVFNGDLSSWNVAGVTDMSYMFGGASVFNGDLSSWNVASVTDMTGMLGNTISFSKQNYEKLLSGWSELVLQNGVTFTAPSVNYCFGKAARDILTDTYNWTITGDSLDSDCLDLNIDADALLQGPYNSTAALMNDDLRTANRIPLTSPYNDGTSVTGTGIFDNAHDGDDIVDWVQIELRNSSDITEVLTTASALIQRDGDIVAPDGISVVTISGTSGDYYVSVNHRNHIAASTAVALTLSATATAIDFTAVANVTGGTNAMAEVSTGKYALFAGDADGNNQVQTGDYNVAATRIGQSGYFGSDTDMNGEVQITDLNLFIARAIGNGIQF